MKEHRGWRTLSVIKDPIVKKAWHRYRWYAGGAMTGCVIGNVLSSYVVNFIAIRATRRFDPWWEYGTIIVSGTMIVLLHVVLKFRNLCRTLKYGSSSISTTSSPRIPLLILRCLLPLDDQDVVVGDLEERFPKRVAELGPFMAKIWYWSQACSFIWPRIKEPITKIAKWGVIGWIGDKVHTLAKHYMPWFR